MLGKLEAVDDTVMVETEVEVRGKFAGFGR